MQTCLIASVDFLPAVGGVSLMTHHVANAMTALGVRAHVLAPAAGALGHDHDYVVHADDTPRAHGLASRAVQEARLRARMRRLVGRERCDAILLMHPDHYGSAALAVARQGDLPLGAMFHGLELRRALLASPWQRPGFRRLERAAARLPGLVLSHGGRIRRLAATADVAFANSSYTAELVRKTGRDAVVTGCGIDLQSFAGEGGSLAGFDRDRSQARRRELGLPDAHCVGFVGRLVESKNVRAMIAALPHAAGWHAVLVGDGPQSAALKQLASDLGVADRAHFLGSCSEARKRQVLAAVDVFCLPSKELPDGAVEGFGIVLLEALACGTPVVVNRSGGMLDVVQHEVTGLVCDAEDPTALAASLVRLVEDDALARRTVEQGQRRIVERFNWTAVARVFVEHLWVASAQRR
ncbi:MAG: glycosyltransferase family 4 protein [Myxococcales bacterium]|nr:glycosyltransferase family 4 protein [Myxococcales bacterium]